MNAKHSGRSYRVHCTECDRVIGVCDPYCSHCGAEQGVEAHLSDSKDEPATRWESFVQSVVIRDDCPCGECAADSWIKMRVLAVAIAPALVALAALAALDVPPGHQVAWPLLLTYVGTKVVTGPINRHNDRYGCVADTEGSET